MKNVLLLSAALLAAAPASFAHTSVAAPVPTSPAMVDFLNEVQIAQVSKTFYKGDFQSIARQNTAQSLHTGHGASLMMSIVQFRD